VRADRPSTTATAVALARALASLPARREAPSHDPVAVRFVPRPLGGALKVLAPLASRSDAVPLAVRVASGGLVDHLGLRTAAIDDALAEALAEALTEGSAPLQVVILGAGLDARAFRLDALRSTRVFEVDHPATQRYKRRHAARLEPRCRALCFVAVDFEREDLGERLAEEGHDPSRPTVWLWEGVVPYLAPAATRATLLAAAARSAPGSSLLVTYGTPQDHLWLARFARPVRLAFRILGEPLRGLLSREAFHALLRDTGWTPRSDTGPADWRARYGWGIEALLQIEERLVVAAH
jgi:methyltransferase (TIGR00027 family)